MKKTKRVLSLVMAVMLLLALSVSAFALDGDIDASQEQTSTYTYKAPTSPLAVDDNIVTASAHRAASPILGMMGVNATSGFGMINGGAPADLAAAQSSAALGVWGSSINDNPDPYYWNYFYNYYAAANDLELSEDALINANVAASPGAADGNLIAEYGNVSYSLYTRPDILVGVASSVDGTSTDGYDSQLATIHSFTSDSPYYQEGDETYNPELVSYQMTYIKQMIESVYRLADAIEEVEDETGKTTRYGDVQTIAGDYEKYVYGIIAYVEEELAAKGLEEKTVAVINSINDDGTYNLCDSVSMSATSLVRAVEYSTAVSKNLIDVLGTDNLVSKEVTTTNRGVTSTSTVLTCTEEQLLQADVIITINNQNITQTQLLNSFDDDVNYKGVIISNTPSALYGMTMNSVENAMGYAYVIGCMYADELDIDPTELCAYFYQHFYHISSTDGIATVVKTNFANCILPEGCSTTLSSSYSAAKIEAQLTKGIEYYEANTGKFTETEYSSIGMDNWSTHLAETADEGIGAVNSCTEHTWVQDSTIAPTCTNMGTTTRHCSVCGTKSVTYTDNLGGHQYADAVTETVAAKIAKAGSITTTQTCSVCNHVKTISTTVIPMKGDLNGDGECNLKDVVYLFSVITGQITED